MRRFTVVMAGLLLLASGSASAIDIYINGTRVYGGITNLELKNVTARFDPAGNLMIDAPGYKVIAQEPPTQPGQVGAQVPLRKHYFIVTEAPTPGTVQYDFELVVNGKTVRRFDSSLDRLVIELNPYLQSGQNMIRINALKNIQGVRKSNNVNDFFKIFVTSGTVTQTNDLAIDPPLLTYSRTAADMGSEVFERSIVAE